MAKLKGILKIQGTLDDLTFYKSGKDHLVRTKGGVDKSRIANDPAFQRTRENGSEFGMAARAGKVLRTAVRLLMANAKDRLVTSRLTKFMTQVKNFDSNNVRGQRTVGSALASEEAKSILKGFDFNIKAILSSIFFNPINLNTETGTVSIPGLVPSNDIVAPNGATHVALKTAWTNVDFETGTFNTVVSNIENIPLNSESVDLVLSHQTPAEGNGCNFFLLHLEFFQEVNGVQYSLRNGAFNALSIIEITGTNPVTSATRVDGKIDDVIPPSSEKVESKIDESLPELIKVSKKDGKIDEVIPPLYDDE